MDGQQGVEFKNHSSSDAPAASAPVLRRYEADGEPAPQLMATLAAAPAALLAYDQLLHLLRAHSTLTAQEIHVVFLTASFENECLYCVAGHSAVARAEGVPPAVVQAIRDGHRLPDARLQALRRFCAQLVIGRGFVAPEHRRAFFEAGYTPAQALDVIAAVAAKTISNYTCQVTGTPLDQAMRDDDWAPPTQLSAA